MSTQVVYWETKDDVESCKQHGICFAGCSLERRGINLKNIRYFSPIRCAKEAAELWVATLCCVLNHQLFTYSYEKSEDYDGIETDGIMWNLKSDGMGWKTALLYLTAFRYIEEFGLFVDDFYKRANDLKTPEELFEKIYETHASDHCPYGKFDIHGLMYSGGSAPTKHPTLSEFRDKITKPSYSVHAFFNP